MDSLGGLTFWHFLLRVVVLYTLVMLALRIMGKREIGQLSVFDFVVSVMIAELSTLPMENTDVPLLRSLLSIGALVVLQFVVSFLSVKSHRFRHWVEGEAAVLISHGKIRDREMRRTRYSMHDLFTQLREKGIMNVADVEFAVLETSGELSVFPVVDKAPLTASDVGLRVDSGGIQKPLIVDGQVMKNMLREINRDEEWLEDEIRRRGYESVDKVFFAAIDHHGRIHIDPMDE